MSNIRNLLEKMDQFAGQAVGQKPGDQVRGTDKATRKKSGEHPFKGRLVGASESAGSLLRELQQELDKPEATVRRDLFREFAEYRQDVSEQQVDEGKPTELTKLLKPIMVSNGATNMTSGKWPRYIKDATVDEYRIDVDFNDRYATQQEQNKIVQDVTNALAGAGYALTKKGVEPWRVDYETLQIRFGIIRKHAMADKRADIATTVKAILKKYHPKGRIYFDRAQEFDKFEKPTRSHYIVTFDDPIVGKDKKLQKHIVSDLTAALTQLGVHLDQTGVEISMTFPPQIRFDFYDLENTRQGVAEEDAWHSSEDAPQDAWHSSQDAPQDAWHGETSESQNNPADAVSMDIPLLIRIMEYAREDAQTDQDLHNVAERLIAMGADGNTLGMDQYDAIVGQPELDEEIVAPATPGVTPTAPAANTAANPAAVAQMKAQQLKTLAAQKKSTQDQIKQTQEQLDALRKQLASLSNPANVAMPSVTGTV